jgi:hypothetical protein
MIATMQCANRCGMGHDNLKWNGKLYCTRCYEKSRRAATEHTWVREQ